MPSLYVINFDGKRELFSKEKIYNSTRRAGSSKKLARRISEIIASEVYPGIKTSEIFTKVRRMLRQESPGVSLKFNLKKAMKKLGPSGFPFEKFVGATFSRWGFKVKLNQQIPGLCCVHEIDFLAEKDNLFYIGECKYRNLPGGRIHSKDALANYARFLDIKKGNFLNKKNYQKLRIKSLLVTNTKFTSRTIRYSKCVGAELLGWGYPKKEGLEYLIGNQKLYPVTILPSLNRYLTEIFVSKKIMLVEDLLRKNINQLIEKTKLSKKSLKPLIEEARVLLKEN